MSQPWQQMWSETDLNADFPTQYWQSRNKHIVEQKIVTFSTNNKEVCIAYQECLPFNDMSQIAAPALLLLHGMRFSSQTWLDLGTLQFAASCGHRVVAVDLPGYGKSTTTEVHDVQYQSSQIKQLQAEMDLDKNGEFLLEFCRCVGLMSPIIVSPSMSGIYTLPYLLSDPGHDIERARAYIPIAPICTESYQKYDYQRCKVPTLILYGDEDVPLGRSSLSHLNNMPCSSVYKMLEAGHPCYIDKPEEWHRILYNTLIKIKE